MHSEQAKALLKIQDKTMLEHVVAAVRAAGISKVCIVANAQLLPSLAQLDIGAVSVCLQHNQLGTGHALASAFPALRAAKPQLGDKELVRSASGATKEIVCEQLLICLADTPALQPSSLLQFIAASRAQDTPFHVIAIRVPDPSGYGRIIAAEDGRLLRIVEEREADASTRNINLCNSGIMLLDTSVTASLLDQLHNNTRNDEYYLTDLLALAPTSIHIVDDTAQFMGVNNLQQLAAIQRQFSEQQLNN